MAILELTFEDMPPLEEVCPICSGSGHNYPDRYDEESSPCPACAPDRPGYDGMAPTEFGKAVLALVRKYSSI